MSEKANSLKPRLVGALILIAVAVIAIPWLLDGAGVEHAFQPLKPVPERPLPPPNQLSEQPFAQPPQPQAPASVPAAQVSEAAPPAETGDAAGEDFPLGAWVVQVASVSREENANALAEELRGAGFPAFVQSWQEAERTHYRVRIGPVARREQAQAVLERLAATQGHKGVIYSYR